MIDDFRDFAGSVSLHPSAIPASDSQVLVTILAAGASSRLGQPKQLVMLDGESLLRRQCGIAFESQIGPLAAVLGGCADECTAAISDLPVTRLTNPCWSEGLGSSIRVAAMAAMDMGVSGLLLLHVDQYRLTTTDLRSLYAVWKESPWTACVSTFGDEFGPPVIFPRRCFASLLKLEGDIGARRILTSLPADDLRLVSILNAVHDLDNPSQLAALLRHSPEPHASRTAT